MAFKREAYAIPSPRSTHNKEIMTVDWLATQQRERRGPDVKEKEMKELIPVLCCARCYTTDNWPRTDAWLRSSSLAIILWWMKSFPVTRPALSFFSLFLCMAGRVTGRFAEMTSSLSLSSHSQSGPKFLILLSLLLYIGPGQREWKKRKWERLHCDSSNHAWQ